MYCTSIPVRMLCAPRCTDITPPARYTLGIWYCGCEVVLPNALMPEILNLGQPALRDGESGRLGIPSSLVELGDPKLGGKTLAPSRVYPARTSRIEAGLRVMVFPMMAFCPRVAVVPYASLSEPSR